VGWVGWGGERGVGGITHAQGPTPVGQPKCHVALSGSATWNPPPLPHPKPHPNPEIRTHSHPAPQSPKPPTHRHHLRLLLGCCRRRDAGRVSSAQGLRPTLCAGAHWGCDLQLSSGMRQAGSAWRCNVHDLEPSPWGQSSFVARLLLFAFQAVAFTRSLAPYPNPNPTHTHPPTPPLPLATAQTTTPTHPPNFVLPPRWRAWHFELFAGALELYAGPADSDLDGPALSSCWAASHGSLASVSLCTRGEASKIGLHRTPPRQSAPSALSEGGPERATVVCAAR